MKKADAVITLGKAMKNNIKNRGIAKEKIFIVPNGVDTKKFFLLEPNLFGIYFFSKIFKKLKPINK